MSWKGDLIKAGICSDGKDVDFFRGFIRLGGREKPGLEGIRILAIDYDKNILICSSPDVPPVATPNFSKGCIFIRTGTPDGTKGIYENQGTTASCDFNIIGDISTVELGDNVVTFAKLQDITTNALIGRASAGDGDPEIIPCTPYAQTLLDDADASTARDTLALGSISTQDADAVNISGGQVSGITDLAIADGGTAASDALNARANLGLAIGSDVQAYDTTLDSIAALGTAADRMIYTTDVDVWAEAILTSFGRSLLNDSDASEARDTLAAEAQDVALDKSTIFSEVGKSDADQTLTAGQLVDNGVFTITPTAARTFTTDTAANIVAAMLGAKVGTNFVFTIVDLASFDITLAGGTGVTITGNAVANNNSASFRAILTNVAGGSEAVTMYRM